MKARFYLLAIWAGLATTAGPPPLFAQGFPTPCGLAGCEVGCQTVFTWQPVTTYREQCEVVYDQREVTRYCPVWETQVRECRYTVLRPETETVYCQQQYTVVTPVWETQMHDASYNRVRNICETHYQEQKYTECRAVTRSEVRTQRQTIRRCVTETIEEEVQQTRWQPVTTYHDTVVDQGSLQTQWVQKEKWAPHCLRWAPAGWGIDPATGKPRYQLPGLAWEKKPGKIKMVARQVWVPNPVTVQVPQTTYQQVVETVKVPRQVARWVEEEVEHKIPVTWQELVREEKVRQVPVTVTRQVVERVERQIPVRVCRAVAEQRVRMVPVTCTRLVCEERVEQVPVRVCKYVARKETICVPRVIRRCVPVVTYCCRPCQVISHVPDACCESDVTLPMAWEGPAGGGCHGGGCQGGGWAGDPGLALPAAGLMAGPSVPAATRPAEGEQSTTAESASSQAAAGQRGRCYQLYPFPWYADPTFGI